METSRRSVRKGRVLSPLVPVILAALEGCAGSDGAPTDVALAGLQAPVFNERAAASGLDHRFDADGDFVVGGGAAAFDCDGDGDLDVAVAGGLAPMAVFENRTSPGAAPRFTEVPAGLAELGDRTRRVTGVYAIDLDNDRAVDLVATRFGENLILRNRGGCAFEEVSRDWGLTATGTWTTAFAAAWIGDARYPTLLFANYVRRDRPLEKRGNCEPSVIVRPRAGTGGPRYGAPEPVLPSSCALSIRQVDWCGPIAAGSAAGSVAATDFWIANDRQYADPDSEEQLLSVGPDSARLYTRADGWAAHRIWGMGVAAADVDGDGRVEVAVTNMAENQFFVLAEPETGRPAFANAAWQRGAAAQRPYTGGDTRPSTSWHSAFEDLNNDGRLDLLIVKGNVAAMPQFAAFDPDSLLLGRGDGRFVEAGAEAGIALDRIGRGGAVFDADGDGCLDILVVNRNGPLSFFHADCAALPPAIDLVLEQDDANRDAVGARIEITAAGQRLDRSIAIGGGHGGSSLAPFHIGAPEAGSAQVRVRWPDGSLSGPVPFSAGEVYRWRRGDPAPVAVRPHQKHRT